jgi:hypothetical protein
MKAWYKIMHLLAVEQFNIGKTELVLMVNEGDELFCFGIAFGEQQVSTTPVMQVCFEFLLECGPACDGFDCQLCFGGVSSLPAYPSGTSPGGCGPGCNLRAFNNEYLSSLSCQVIGDRTADYSAADNQYFRSGDVQKLSLLFMPLWFCWL